MPKSQIIYDLLDLVTRFETKTTQDDFAVYIYSIYAHNRSFRYVRIFEGIFDKDVLQNFLDANALDITDYLQVREAINWEFTLWMSAIKVRKNKAKDFPRISQIIIDYLDDLCSKSREILNATVNYLGTIDITEFVAKLDTLEDDDDEDDDVSKSSTSSSISLTTGIKRPKSVTLEEVHTICKNHVLEATERNKRIIQRDAYIQKQLQKESHKQTVIAHRELVKIEKEHKKVEKDNLKIEKAAAKAQRAAEDAADRETKKQIRELEKERLAELRAEKEARRLQKDKDEVTKSQCNQEPIKIRCDCGIALAPSALSSHLKCSVIHKTFIDKPAKA